MIASNEADLNKAPWSSKLRENEDRSYYLDKLLRSEGKKRYEAAKALLDCHDRDNHALYANLKKGEKLFDKYIDRRIPRCVMVMYFFL
jgi:hypothetical protein